MIDIETITPQQLLLMPVDEYLRTFGNKNAPKRAIAILCTKLLKNADRLRNNLRLDRTAFTLSVRLWREMSLD